MTEKLSIDQLIDGVKQHAKENYDRDGWEVIVECYDNSEIAQLVREAGAETLEDAIAVVAAIAKSHDGLSDNLW